MAPHQVTPNTVPEVWDRLFGQRLDPKTPPPKCQVGDRVRLNKKHRPFKKGYLPGWTEEVWYASLMSLTVPDQGSSRRILIQLSFNST